MNIGSTNMRQIPPIKTPAGKPGDNGPVPPEKPRDAAASPAGATTTESNLAMKAKMVEVLLVVKKETKTSVTTQAGIAQQATGEGQTGLDLAALTYNGKPLSELNPEEAQTLIAEEGYFGVKKTAQRIADFVLAGGGDNLDRLRSGRDGVLQGFAEAEKAWGGKLPEISYQTLNKALELIDKRVNELGGGTVLDVSA